MTIKIISFYKCLNDSQWILYQDGKVIHSQFLTFGFCLRIIVYEIERSNQFESGDATIDVKYFVSGRRGPYQPWLGVT